MTKERHQSRCLMFTIAALRLMEREKEWNADILDQIADFALDLGLATTDKNGNFIVESVDKE